MTYTQAELRMQFPVYDPADPKFAAWLVADDTARIAWTSLSRAMRNIMQAASVALLRGLDADEV